MKDTALLKEKIDKIKNDGPANFEIMTDYDMTLTRYFYLHPNSKGVDPEDKADTSFKALSMSQYLSEEAKERNRQLYDKFHPIEINPALTLQEKSDVMQRWWEQNMESFLISKMSKSDYGRVVMQSKVLFRYGMDELIHIASQ